MQIEGVLRRPAAHEDGVGSAALIRRGFKLNPTSVGRSTVREITLSASLFDCRTFLAA